MSVIVGVELGQVEDYTAVAAVEIVPVDGGKPELHVRHLDRYRGLPYTAVVDKLDDLMSWPALYQARLLVDATGVGRAVVDLLKERRHVEGVTITSGASAYSNRGEHYIPKRDLVAAIQVALQGRRLKIAQMPLTQTLLDEMANFRVNISEAGRDSYAAGGAGHDDLVLAVALAVWGATSRPDAIGIWREVLRRRGIDLPVRQPGEWREALARGMAVPTRIRRGA